MKPTIKERDRYFWIALKKSWSKWTDALIILKPETVYRLAKEALQKALNKNII